MTNKLYAYFKQKLEQAQIRRCVAKKRLVPFMHNHRKYYLNPDDSAEYHIKHSIRKIDKMANLIDREVNTIVDVGANCGLFSAFASERLPKVTIHAFEPSSELIPVIEKNCRNSNVFIHETALGEKEEEKVFYLNPDSQQTSSFNLDAVLLISPKERIEERVVSCITLDAFVDNLSITNVDVLKIDVQGFEGAVLRGARQTMPQVQQLFIESTWIDIESIVELIPFGLHYGFTHVAVINSVFSGADILLSRKKVSDSSIQISFELNEKLLAGQWH